MVDQSASIGAQPLAVVRDMGCPVGHIPGLTMRRIADLCPGEAKTDAKDAFIIAALRAVDGEDETSAELEMIVGFDEDLADEATRVANRLPGLLTQIHPSLERVLGPRLQHPAVLALRERFAAPDAQGRPTSAGHAAAAESTEDGRTAGREGTSSPAAHPAPDRPHMPAPPNGAANSSRQWLFPDGPPGQHLSDTVLGRRPAAHHIPNRPRPGHRPRRPRPGPSPPAVLGRCSASTPSPQPTGDAAPPPTGLPTSKHASAALSTDLHTSGGDPIVRKVRQYHRAYRTLSAHSRAARHVGRHNHRSDRP